MRSLEINITGIRQINGTTKIARTWIAPAVCRVQFCQLCVLAHPICLSPCGRSSSRGGGWMWQETGHWAAASLVRVPQSPTLQCYRTGWWSLDFCSMSSPMVSNIFLISDSWHTVLDVECISHRWDCTRHLVCSMWQCMAQIMYSLLENILPSRTWTRMHACLQEVSMHMSGE